MPPAQRFDADKKSSDRQAMVINIGGTKFNPRKRSVKMMDEWVAATPETAMSEEELTEASKEDRLLAFRSMVNQLTILIVDEEKNAPEVDFLLEELDVEDGFELLEMLTPKIAEQEEQAGNSDAAEAETAT